MGLYSYLFRNEIDRWTHAKNLDVFFFFFILYNLDSFVTLIMFLCIRYGSLNSSPSVFSLLLGLLCPSAYKQSINLCSGVPHTSFWTSKLFLMSPSSEKECFGSMSYGPF